MKDIMSYDTFFKIEPVNKGWSSDKKYCIQTVEEKSLLLRVADASLYDQKKAEFEIMKKVAALGVPMSQPIEFGTCDGGKNVYSLLSWCDGEDAEVVLPRLTGAEQYELGVESGKILKTIHSIDAPNDQEEWGVRFNRKTSIKVEKYRACGIQFEGDHHILDYIENNRHLLSGRPQCYQHGDYHVGNMILSSDHKLSIIDFNRPDFGDPWEEFNRIVWSAAVSPHFATGQFNGYFGGEPPIEFFKLLAFYIASNTLSSIYWAIQFGEEEVEVMKEQAKDVLGWYGDMKSVVPGWYLGNEYYEK